METHVRRNETTTKFKQLQRLLKLLEKLKNSAQGNFVFDIQSKRKATGENVTLSLQAKTKQWRFRKIIAAG